MTPVTFTNNIPICPNCQVGTERTAFGGPMTNVGMAPTLNTETHEFSIGPDTVIQVYQCHTCNKYYGVATRNGESEYYEVKQP